VYPLLFGRTILIFLTSSFFFSSNSRRRRSMELVFLPVNFIISARVLNPSGIGGHSLFWMCSCRSFCQGFRGDFIRRILCLSVGKTCCPFAVLGKHRGSCLGRSYQKPSRVASGVCGVGLDYILGSCCINIRY